MTKKRFLIKKLVESYEIQKSYDSKNYLEAVFKCRAYLENWLLEYIYAIIYPMSAEKDKTSRELIEGRFNSMFIQLDWLLKQGHITKKDYENLNKIRRFCDRVMRTGDVFKVVPIEELDKFIEAALHYCHRLKERTRVTIEKATGQQIQQ